jgi:nucleotide-binding universal stress UspA family protein
MGGGAVSDVKNILAVVGDIGPGQRVLVTALKTAAHLGAHVDALHVRPDPILSIPLTEGMSAQMIDELASASERNAVARAAKTRAMFDATVAGSAATWIEDAGAEDHIVAVRACRADLIVVSPPSDDDPDADDTLHAALMETGRAVLTAPANAGANAFKRIVIFWNGSAEVTRAVSAAMPFLARADQVTVLRVEEDEWHAPTDDLEAYFKHHGIAVTIAELVPKGARTGEALLSAAMSTNADLLVMGAYTRSKLRQLMFGSVTGYIIAHAKLPVLLCH